MHVRVEDAHAHHERATSHGAKIHNLPTDYPYGERQYSAEDPGGHRWAFSQSIADVDPPRLLGSHLDQHRLDLRSRMPILQIDHTVRDYDAWKQAFDSDPVGRERGGVRRYRIARLTDDPNHVLIELEFDDAGAAQEFQTKLRELWSRVGGDLGLENPTARIVEAVESNEYGTSS